MFTDIPSSATSAAWIMVLRLVSCGKTSLLYALCERASGYAHAQGSITVNGSAVTSAQLSKLTGFVPQQDVHHEVPLQIEVGRVAQCCVAGAHGTRESAVCGDTSDDCVITMQP